MPFFLYSPFPLPHNLHSRQEFYLFFWYFFPLTHNQKPGTCRVHNSSHSYTIRYAYIQQPSLTILKYWQNSRSQLDTRKWKSIQTNNKDIQISVCRKYRNLLKENVRENPIPLLCQHMGYKSYITENETFSFSFEKIFCIAILFCVQCFQLTPVITINSNLSLRKFQ